MNQIRAYQFTALCGAVKLQQKGMKHSSGRSVRRYAAVLMGLNERASYEDVIRALTNAIEKENQNG
jgi:hypothetical protein